LEIFVEELDVACPAMLEPLSITFLRSGADYVELLCHCRRSLASYELLVYGTTYLGEKTILHFI